MKMYFIMKKFTFLVFGFCVLFSFHSNSWARDAIKIRSENFQLSGEIDPKNAIKFIDNLEQIRFALLDIHAITDTAQEQVLQIYVITDPEIFKALGVAKNFVAIYRDTDLGPRALVNGSILESGELGEETLEILRSTILHEYVHYFSTTHLDFAMPRWAAEGIAEYYATFVQLDNGDFQFGTPEPHNQLVLTYPIKYSHRPEELLQTFTEVRHHGRYGTVKGWKRPPNHIEQFYAQSWALVHYLMNQPGGEANIKHLVEHMVVVRAGLSIELQQAYKGPQAQVYDPYMGLGSDNVTLLSTDEATRKVIQKYLGMNSDELADKLHAYAAASDIPIQTYHPKTVRQYSTLEVETMTEAQAAAEQFRLLSLTSSQITINQRMKDLRALIEASPLMETDPKFKSHYLTSLAAQKYILEFTPKATELVNTAIELNPENADAISLKTTIRYQQFVNHTFMNGDEMRSVLRGVLSKRPYDPSLLAKMAATHLSEVNAHQNPEESIVISPEVMQALSRLEAKGIVERAPFRTLPVLNVYLAMEEYRKALYVAKRAIPFTESSWRLQGLIKEVESYIKEDEKTL